MWLKNALKRANELWDLVMFHRLADDIVFHAEVAKNYRKSEFAYKLHKSEQKVINCAPFKDKYGQLCTLLQKRLRLKKQPCVVTFGSDILVRIQF